MKRYFFFLLIGILTSCSKESKLSFDTYEFHSIDCERCVKADITFPIALGEDKVVKSINDSILQFAVRLVEGPESSSWDVSSAIKKMENEYDRMRQEFSDLSADWVFNLDGEVGYQGQQLISIRLNTYSYTGGAHGNGGTYYLNFDPQTGNILSNETLFSSIEDFQEFAEIKFREKYGISPTLSINSTGFWFSDEHFNLPEAIGVEGDSLHLIYQTYEIASYADGGQELGFSLSEVANYLNFKL